MKNKTDKNIIAPEHYSIEKKPNGMVEITGEIPYSDLLEYEDRAFEKVSQHVEIDGFRKGHAPRNMVKEKAGNLRMLEEMAQTALAHIYPFLIKEKNIDAIGRPEMHITKIGEGSPLGFRILTATMPAINLSSYADIAKKHAKKTETSVTDQEIDAAILELRKMQAHHEMHEKNVPHENHNHNEINESDLAPLDDEAVKKFGNFENITDFRAKFAENLKKEKQGKARDEQRVEIMNDMIASANLEIPEILVDYELEKMFAQFAHDLAGAGLDMKEYLGKIQKTEQDLKKTWHDEALKRVAGQLIIDHIAKKESLEPGEEEIAAEIKKIMEFYKDLEGVNEPGVRSYVTKILQNERVFSFLESQV